MKRRSRIKHSRKRRPQSLCDGDYDHEIYLTDDEVAETPRDIDQHLDADNADGTAAIPDAALLCVPEALAGAALSPAQTAGSTAPLLHPSATQASGLSGISAASATPSDVLRDRSRSRGRKSMRFESVVQVIPTTSGLTPTVEVHDATPDIESRDQRSSLVSPRQLPRSSMQSMRSDADWAIDVLYENERGGFLCGIALFSSRALGNLDPAPWTNADHGTSPTDIHTAQVPDPTWEWAWPGWHIYRDGQTDDEGWLYSFMFSAKFSWHGPRWYNSFVRRRAWMRRRVKRHPSAAMSATAMSLALGEIDSITDPHLLNPSYFTVLPAASVRRSQSRASSHVTSRSSTARASLSQESRLMADDEDGSVLFELPAEIEDADVLMRALRSARIDRERIDAIQNFLAHAGADLVHLQDLMHDIMALFVFQTSRRTLLSVLNEAHTEAVKSEANAQAQAVCKRPSSAEEPDHCSASSTKQDKGKNRATDANTDANADAGAVLSFPADDAAADVTSILPATSRRVEYLTAAIKHADEEVRRLEYWSDIKAMAHDGASRGAVTTSQVWDADQWQGTNNGGPLSPPPPKPSNEASPA